MHIQYTNFHQFLKNQLCGPTDYHQNGIDEQVPGFFDPQHWNGPMDVLKIFQHSFNPEERYI